MNKFIVCDIGKKETYVFVPETNNHYVISNENFIKRAPKDIVAHEKQKLEDMKTEYSLIKQNLDILS